MEPVEIFIDSTEYSTIVYCGECADWRELHSTSQSAKKSGRKHRDTFHNDRGINTITIHSE